MFDEGKGGDSSVCLAARFLGRQHDRRPSLEAPRDLNSPECSDVARREFHPALMARKSSRQGPAKGSGFYATDRARKQ